MWQAKIVIAIKIRLIAQPYVVVYKDLRFYLYYRFVEGVLSFYYKSDEEVQKDSELQKWISDIFEHGFLSQENTGRLWKKRNVDTLPHFTNKTNSPISIYSGNTVYFH